ncbi:MAG TPA: PIN domain-containing protein [Jiangellaceae bacterium]|nr:PIN domain-containing protein [Jiangellaceae bacterium]
MIVDTSALLSFFDRTEPHHEPAVKVIVGSRDPLVVSPYVLAELDYLVASHLDVTAELAVLREMAGGAWELAALDAKDVIRAASVVQRYADQEIGLADASIVVLAERYGTRRVATLDRRHFEVLRPFQGGRFTIVP